MKNALDDASMVETKKRTYNLQIERILFNHYTERRK
jgi:hypothetical protein